jgi:hypothetical protein
MVALRRTWRLRAVSRLRHANDDKRPMRAIGVFQEYEDRILDLLKPSPGSPQ